MSPEAKTEGNKPEEETELKDQPEILATEQTDSVADEPDNNQNYLADLTGEESQPEALLNATSKDVEPDSMEENTDGAPLDNLIEGELEEQNTEE